MAFTDAGIRSAIKGHEVGGGDGWTPDLHPADADREVSTLSGLKSALSSSAGTIAIADGAEIDVSNEHMGINLRNKRLVSYRGWDGRSGGLLYSTRRGYVGTDNRPFTPMYSEERDPQVHGLRIRGADHDRTTFRPARDASGNQVYRDTLARAIMLRGSGGRVSNCEIWGWPWTCVHLKGRDSRITYGEVDHCLQYRSPQIGYGYGTDVWRGVGNIHHNYFNEVRGAIDGFGFYNSGYEVHRNIFGPTNYRHAVDMHCLVENKSHASTTDPTHPRWALRAGGKMDVHHNQFCFNRSNRNTGINAIAIRGVPWDYIDIKDNWFLHSRRPPTNTANRQTGEAWRQINVTSTSYGTVPLDSRGFTPNFRDSGNEFGVTSLQLDALGRGGSGGGLPDPPSAPVPGPVPVGPLPHERERNRAWARGLRDMEESLGRLRSNLGGDQSSQQAIGGSNHGR